MDDGFGAAFATMLIPLKHIFGKREAKTPNRNQVAPHR
jgi:hypothetical protein